MDKRRRSFGCECVRRARGQGPLCSLGSHILPPYIRDGLQRAQFASTLSAANSRSRSTSAGGICCCADSRSRAIGVTGVSPGNRAGVGVGAASVVAVTGSAAGAGVSAAASAVAGGGSGVVTTVSDGARAGSTAPSVASADFVAGRRYHVSTIAKPTVTAAMAGAVMRISSRFTDSIPLAKPLGQLGVRFHHRQQRIWRFRRIRQTCQLLE
jgi:hypothetical protein